MARRGTSIRLWQTVLFIAVIVVAILILSGSISAGLRQTLTRLAQTSELRNASALAQRLAEEFPVTVNGTSGVRQTVQDYRDIYGGGIWVYEPEGDLLESAYDGSPLAAELEAARMGALDAASYVSADFRPNGWVVAGKPIRDEDGTLQGVVVTASSSSEAVAILQSVRQRIWAAFWVSLAIAGLLGFGFSEFIGRRMRAMSDAAAAIAAGDFEQRLPTRFVPNELSDMAQSYNTMATKLGEAFADIQESQREISAVVESMAEGVLALDADGFIRVINPEAIRLLRISGDDLVGRPLDSLTSEPELLEIARAGLDARVETRTVALGSEMVLLHCTPLTDATGHAEGAVLLLADVTEAFRVEDAQRRFVADASHEMRTPIAALKGMLELLIDGAKNVPEVRDDFLNTMQFEVERLGRLVADLLTLAQLEAGNLRLKRAPEYVVDLLGDVSRVMQTLAEQAGVSLSVEAFDDESRVLCDRDKIVQVLLSLTDNALKHSSPGATIHLRSVPAENGVRLEIADEGTGIEADELSRVFERFYRADAARGGGGAGLGLAIAKEIVEAHGATMEVESELGVGTTFGFVLPKP